MDRDAAAPKEPLPENAGPSRSPRGFAHRHRRGRDTVASGASVSWFGSAGPGNQHRTDRNATRRHLRSGRSAGGWLETRQVDPGQHHHSQDLGGLRTDRVPAGDKLLRRAGREVEMARRRSFQTQIRILMSYLLFPGRHLVNTRFQESYPRRVLSTKPNKLPASSRDEAN